MTSLPTTGIPDNQQVDRLRRAYPVFRIESARAVPNGSSVNLEFGFSVGNTVFKPVVRLHGLLAEEMERLDTETSRRLVRALGIVEAFSYWKAYCSPVIEVALPSFDTEELQWWQSFWPHAMGEFFYRNGIDFTETGFLTIRAGHELAEAGPETSPEMSPIPPPAEAGPGAAAVPPLVMFSGGKDSLALALVVGNNGRSPIDCFLYNPTPSQANLAESLLAGGRTLRVERAILPELLALNAANHPNGHTPYSAYLGLAAMLLGYLRGGGLVLAGNSRSDDEPNIESYLGRTINHQWTKTYEFEAALRQYRDRWTPHAPTYSSPFRPLFELQIVASLSGSVDAYLQTASCNRTKGAGWCRACAKCAWVFLATSVLFGMDLAIQKIGANLFNDPGLAGLYERMAGLVGTKPFECTGTEEEVRVAIRHVQPRHPAEDFRALASCLRTPAVAEARSLDSLLADWGQDDLVPGALVEHIRGIRTTQP